MTSKKVMAAIVVISSFVSYGLQAMDENSQGVELSPAAKTLYEQLIPFINNK